jgi:tetratricopeptide (TPR) repeat protein
VTDLPVPDRIGRYHCKRVIAIGGMGIVYEAVQEHPHRTVALKVMKAGIASRSVLRRFEYESQILARLRHPNIAQVYEAGTHDDGRGAVPYFAMEYIPNAKGLTEYVRDARLSTRQRLELFAKVCDAVHHGHQKGIIHRDLKPGNILVDSAAEPKIIDFGVARATDSDMAITTLQTDVGQLIGTLQYMSPEQCEADPHDLDLRSDVYALGVVLYELLCDQLPYDVSHAAVYEAARVIREETPTKPSMLNRLLRGDLETIALKALEKDRNQRYQSSAEFAADLRHYLHDEPIVARRPSALYQFRKFARRNKLLVGGTVALIVVLAAGGAVSTFLAIGQARQAQLARQVNDFLREDVLGSIDLGRTPFSELTVETILNEATENIEGRFEEEPLVEAEIRTTLGQSYSRIGRYQESRAHYERAYELRRTELGEEAAKTLRSKRTLGHAYHRVGESAEARAMLSETLEQARRLLGPADPETLSTMNTLGWVLNKTGDYDQAERLLSECLEERRRVLGPEKPNTVSTIRNLAWVYIQQGRYDDAEPLMLKVLEIRRRLRGEDHRTTASAMIDVGGLYKRQGHYDKAEPLLTEALERRREVYGDEHPTTLWAVSDLGWLYKDMARYEESEQLFKEALEGRRRVHGTEHPNTATSVYSLGTLYLAWGRNRDAERLLTEALDLRRRIHGPEHPNTLAAMGNLAGAHYNLGRYEQAEPLWTELLAIYRAKFGNEHSNVIWMLRNLSSLYSLQGRFPEAQARFTEALDLARRALGEEHPSTLAVMAGLADVLLAQGEYDGVEPLLVETIEIQTRVLGEDHPSTLKSKNTMAWYLMDRHPERIEEAATLAREASEGGERRVGRRHLNTINNYDTLALILIELGRIDEAEAICGENVTIASREHGDDHLITQMCRSRLGACLVKLRRFEEAEALLLEALPRIQSIGGLPEEVEAAAESLIELYTETGQPGKAEKYRPLLE